MDQFEILDLFLLVLINLCRYKRDLIVVKYIKSDFRLFSVYVIKHFPVATLIGILLVLFLCVAFNNEAYTSHDVNEIMHFGKNIEIEK